MTSVLVKATIKGKTPTQMIKDLNKYNKYAAASINCTSIATSKGQSKLQIVESLPPTSEELDRKSTELGLVDGLPFTYVFFDRPEYGESTINIDLQAIEDDYREIHYICNYVVPYSPVIGIPSYKPFAFRPERKSGFTRLTDLLCNQLRFIYESIISLQHSLIHDDRSTMSELLKLENSIEKLRMIGKLSTLSHDFRRNHFEDIPFLLEIVESTPDADFYLFNYEGSFDDPQQIDEESFELLETVDHPLANPIRENAIERERLKLAGVDIGLSSGTSAVTTYALLKGLSGTDVDITQFPESLELQARMEDIESKSPQPVA
jgi:hypothetical protein